MSYSPLSEADKLALRGDILFAFEKAIQNPNDPVSSWLRILASDAAEIAAYACQQAKEDGYAEGWNDGRCDGYDQGLEEGQ